MKRNHIAALFFLVSLTTLASCSKFTNGDPIDEHRDIGRFRAISMYNNVNVKLIQDSHPRIALTCPRNLIEKVTTELDGDTLVIKNENDFNWLRSYDYSIDMTVYFDSLSGINYASNGYLICTDTLRGTRVVRTDTIIDGQDTIYLPVSSNTFFLNVNEGSGNIDLTLNCDQARNRLNNGTASVTLRGMADYTEHLNRCYGLIHAENLQSTFVRVRSESPNDIYVWSRFSLRAWIYSMGDIYYKGHPEISIEDCTSSGRVIKME